MLDEENTESSSHSLLLIPSFMGSMVILDFMIEHGANTFLTIVAVLASCFVIWVALVWLMNHVYGGIQARLAARPTPFRPDLLRLGFLETSPLTFEGQPKSDILERYVITVLSESKSNSSRIRVELKLKNPLVRALEGLSNFGGPGPDRTIVGRPRYFDDSILPLPDTLVTDYKSPREFVIRGGRLVVEYNLYSKDMGFRLRKLAMSVNHFESVLIDELPFWASLEQLPWRANVEVLRLFERCLPDHELMSTARHNALEHSRVELRFEAVAPRYAPWVSEALGESLEGLHGSEQMGKTIDDTVGNDPNALWVLQEIVRSECCVGNPDIGIDAIKVLLACRQVEFLEELLSDVAQRGLPVCRQFVLEHFFRDARSDAVKWATQMILEPEMRPSVIPTFIDYKPDLAESWLLENLPTDGRYLQDFLNGLLEIGTIECLGPLENVHAQYAGYPRIQNSIQEALSLIKERLSELTYGGSLAVAEQSDKGGMTLDVESKDV